MLAELPELPALRARIFRELLVEVVLGDLRRRLIFLAQLQPGRVVAGQADIKTGVCQRLHLAAQDRLVGRRLRQDVVGVHEGAPLQLAQALDLDAGELRVAPLPRR